MKNARGFDTLAWSFVASGRERPRDDVFMTFGRGKTMKTEGDLEAEWCTKPGLPLKRTALPKKIFWRPRRDLNPCCRRERPMSWARLDDGDANGEPCWIRTSDPLLKSELPGPTEYHTLLNLLGFSSHFSPQSNYRQRPFGESSRTKGGQNKDCCQG